MPNETLEALSVKRTTHFCLFCSVPVCADHRTLTGHCSHECRNLTPSVQKSLVQMLNKYVPDWRTAGPSRCEVCNLPVYRYSVCRRHFDQLKRGKTKLVPQRLRRLRREAITLMAVTVAKDTHEKIKRIVEVEGGTVSSYVESLVDADLKARFEAIREVVAKRKADD